MVKSGSWMASHQFLPGTCRPEQLLHDAKIEKRTREKKTNGLLPGPMDVSLIEK